MRNMERQLRKTRIDPQGGELVLGLSLLYAVHNTLNNVTYALPIVGSGLRTVRTPLPGPPLLEGRGGTTI